MTPALTSNTTAGAIMRRIRIRLSVSQRRALISLIKSTNDVNLRIRAHAVLLYSERLGCNKIAQSLCCAPSTAVNAANRYLEGGIEALADGRQDASQKTEPAAGDEEPKALRDKKDYELSALELKQVQWAKNTW